MVLEIDGGEKSGSGTIIRDAVPFAVLIGRDVHVKNIRVQRPKPGLRPQHLKVIESCSRICGGQVDGAFVGSREIRFHPGGAPRGGTFDWDIGTAGSAVLLALSVIPLGLFADTPSEYRITGGLFQDFAPSVHHVQQVLLPLLRSMGARIRMTILQPGYVPGGKGRLEVQVQPLGEELRALRLQNQGKVAQINGKALSSHLETREVSQRMARTCEKALRSRGYPAHVEPLEDTARNPAFERPSIQAGASLAIWARTDTGCILGADMAGAPRRTAETIGKRTAQMLVEDLETGATVDRHVADQIIPFACLAEGHSLFVIPTMTPHVETRLWLAGKTLGAKSTTDGHTVTIHGTGWGPLRRR